MNTEQKLEALRERSKAEDSSIIYLELHMSTFYQLIAHKGGGRLHFPFGDTLKEAVDNAWEAWPELKSLKVTRTGSDSMSDGYGPF